MILTLCAVLCFISHVYCSTLLQTYTVVAGVNPLVGLWTTVVLGFFAALFGGRAGICSSASGACACVGKFLCMNDYVFYDLISYSLYSYFSYASCWTLYITWTRIFSWLCRSCWYIANHCRLCRSKLLCI